MGHGRRAAGPRSLHELPRTKVALEALNAMFVEGANEVAGGMSTEAIASLDDAVAGHVLAAVRTQAGEMLRAMRGAVASPDAQEAGGRFVGAAVTSLEVKDVLISLGIRDVLVAAVKQHPRHPGVQDSVQYALLKVVGWRAPAEVLGDPELAASPQAVSAALWALGSRGAGSEQHWDVDSLAALPWAERRELAELARAALERFPDNLVLRSRSLDVMGLMLGAKVPGSDHEVAAMAVPPIVLAMQAHLDDRDLQWSAARALVRVVEGNSSAIRSLRAYRNEFIALLDSIMALQEHSQTLSNLSRVRLTVAGVVGVLEAIQGGRWGNAQVEASLQAIEKAEECDSSSLLKIDAVGLIITRGMGQDCPAPAGITALGRVLEFLIQDATAAACSTGGDLSQHQDAIQRGVDAIVCRLQAEVQSVEAGGKPYVKVYSRALIALRNVSRRSDSLGARIAASPTVKAAMKIALERDYWKLTHDALEQLVAAVSFFSGLHALLGLLEQYPSAPWLHEVACKVLVGDAEHQDGATAEGSVLHSAPQLAFWATGLLTGMVRNCPNPKYNPVNLAISASELLGHVLGFVEPGLFLPAQQARQAAEAGEGAGGDGGPRGPVLEDGLAALTGLLSFFPNSRPLAAEVCRALVRARVAWASRAAPGSSGPLLGILGALSAGEAIVRLANRFPENVAVVNEAALAMGVLGGFGPVVDLMRGRPACLVAQEAGCCALVEMCRLGSVAMDAVRHEDVAPARVVVEQARARFQSVGAAGGMLSRAELALGMLSALVAPPGGAA